MRTLIPFLCVALLPLLVQAATDLELVERHIPVFHFDKNAQNDCYPDEAREENDTKCKPFNATVPVYYKVEKCEGYTKIAYWLWYGWQGKCSLLFADHGNDWEHVVVNLLPDESMHSVTYYQHNGWFTDCKQPQNPVVYVGEIAHGSYNGPCTIKDIVNVEELKVLPPEFCISSCGYWTDHRIPGGIVWTPTKDNLQPVPTSGRLSERHSEEYYFSPATKNQCYDSLNQFIRVEVMQNGCWRQIQEPSCIFPAPDSCAASSGTNVFKETVGGITGTLGNVFSG